MCQRTGGWAFQSDSWRRSPFPRGLRGGVSETSVGSAHRTPGAQLPASGAPAPQPRSPSSEASCSLGTLGAQLLFSAPPGAPGAGGGGGFGPFLGPRACPSNSLLDISRWTTHSSAGRTPRSQARPHPKQLPRPSCSHTCHSEPGVIPDHAPPLPTLSPLLKIGSLPGLFPLPSPSYLEPKPPSPVPAAASISPPPPASELSSAQQLPKSITTALRRKSRIPAGSATSGRTCSFPPRQSRDGPFPPSFLHNPHTPASFPSLCFQNLPPQSPNLLLPLPGMLLLPYFRGGLLFTPQLSAIFPRAAFPDPQTKLRYALPLQSTPTPPLEPKRIFHSL